MSKHGLYCIYDYKESLSTGRQSYASPGKISYLSAGTASVKSLEEYSSFREMMSSFRTDRPLLVMVHGWEVNLKGYLKRVKDVSELYDVDLLTFHWPSKMKAPKGGLVKDFEYVRTRIDDMLPSFLRFTEELTEYLYTAGESCNIVFLSLANLFAQRYAETLPGGAESPFHNLMLNEACVLRKDSRIWLERLQTMVSGSVYVTSNQHDQLLKIEENCFKRGPNLGHGPCPEEDRTPGVRYMDVSEYYKGVIDPMFSHMFYLGPFNQERQPVYAYFRQVFTARRNQQ